MDRQFLGSAEFNKQNIMNNVLAPHGFDGAKAQRDLAALVHEEKVRQFSRKLLYVAVSGTVFSLYNVGRMAHLSPSGRPAAIAGLAFFTYLTYTSAARAGYLGRGVFNAPPKQEPSLEQKTE